MWGAEIDKIELYFMFVMMQNALAMVDTSIIVIRGTNLFDEFVYCVFSLNLRRSIEFPCHWSLPGNDTL